MKGGRYLSPRGESGDQPDHRRAPPSSRPPTGGRSDQRAERNGPPPWAQKKAGKRGAAVSAARNPPARHAEHRGGGRHEFPRQAKRGASVSAAPNPPEHRAAPRAGPRRPHDSHDSPREPRPFHPRSQFPPPRREHPSGHAQPRPPFREGRPAPPRGFRRDDERREPPRGARPMPLRGRESTRPFPPRKHEPARPFPAREHESSQPSRPRSSPPHERRAPRVAVPSPQGPPRDARAPRPPGPANPRRVALDVLSEWEDSGTYADALLAGIDETTRFANPSDRALLHALVLGVLRHKTMLDIWIAELNQRGRLTAPVRWILRLGLFQLFKMGIAEHAAVDESVRLTFEEKPLVNAILRRALDEKDHLLAIEGDAAAWEKFSLPDFLIERWRWLFGEEGMLKLAGLMGQPSEMFVRLNRLNPWATVPAGAEPVEGMPDFFKVATLPRAELEAGQCYVQDPSTWFAVSKLDVRPGLTVLDACAAPGGKAALLAQFMENQGLLVATDSSPRRIRRLADNLKRLGVTCADCRTIDWKSGTTADDGRRYDRILLDVPCSNTGVMRRRVDVRWRVTPAVVAEMAEAQARILRATIPLLAPGGKLSYSTCSLEPAENDQQVDRALAEFPHLSLIEKKLILPHETGFDGAFVAILEDMGTP